MYIMISRVITIEVLEKTEKIEDGRHCPRSNNKLMEQIRDFGFYHRVFRYAGHGGVAKKYLRYWAAGKSKMAATFPRSNNQLMPFLT